MQFIEFLNNFFSWLCCYMSQMNPLIGPILKQSSLFAIKKYWVSQQAFRFRRTFTYRIIYVLLQLLYRVFRSGMCFSRCLKMTEKRNLHYKTRLFCYQNLPPFHFIAINPVKFFNKCSNLTNVGSQDFAEKFDPHWYEISQIVFFTFIMVPRVHLCHSFLWE